MVPTPENFGQKVACKICGLEDDTTGHILSCLFLKLEVPEVSKVTLSDIYNTDVEKMKFVAEIFEKVWRKREEILYNMSNIT